MFLCLFLPLHIDITNLRRFWGCCSNAVGRSNDSNNALSSVRYRTGQLAILIKITKKIPFYWPREILDIDGESAFRLLLDGDDVTEELTGGQDELGSKGMLLETISTEKVSIVTGWSSAETSKNACLRENCLAG